jgi:hypothetical protein
MADGGSPKLGANVAEGFPVHVFAGGTISIDGRVTGYVGGG